MDRARLFGISLVVVSAVAYGSGGLFAQPAYAAGIDWMTLMAWRFGLAAVLSWVLVLTRPAARAAVRVLERRAILVALGLGVWFVSNSATYYGGIETVPLSLAALIIYIYPPVVAVLALFVGRPLQGRRAWTALLIAVAGVMLAVGGIDTSVMPPLSGLVLIIASPLFYAGWIILAARHSGETREGTGAQSDRSTNALVMGAVILTGTAITYWVTALAIGHPVLPAEVPADAWPGILGVALVAGFVAPQAFYAGAKHVGAAQAALLSTVEPLWTIVAAGVLLGETLTGMQWAGGALILGGVLLSQTRPRGARGGRGTGPADDPVLPQPVVRFAEE